jgi:hypothetical protein
MTHHVSSYSVLAFLAGAVPIVLAADRPAGAGQAAPKYLLLDARVVDRVTNAQLVMGTVRKHPRNPLFGEDRPWEPRYDNMYPNVLYDEQEKIYKCWYTPFITSELDDKTPRENRKEVKWKVSERMFGLCYAISKDGLHWTKPAVAEDGRSNLVLPGTGENVMIDPTVPWRAPDKYKAAYMHKDASGESNALTLARSADGIRWTPYNDGKPVTHRAADTHNQIIWDPLRKKYRVSTRTDLAGGGGATEFRSCRIMYHEDNDLEGRPRAWETLKDRIVVGGPAPRRYPGSQSEVRQFHHITCWIHEGAYFGLMNVWNEPRQELCAENDFQTRHDRDVSDFHIGTSRDGLEFDKSWVYAATPLVRRGEAGVWDKDFVGPPGTILNWQDEHRIYYCGMNERIWNLTPERKSLVGLATIRRDGLVCLEAAGEAGMILTTPFVLAGRALEVNADASGGALRVELLDEACQGIAGYAGKWADALKRTDSVRLRPAWGEHKDLAPLVGRVVRLRFHLANAKLYAFQVVR